MYLKLEDKQLLDPLKMCQNSPTTKNSGINLSVQNVSACRNVQLTYTLHPGAGLFNRTTSTCTPQAHTADGW